jgi:DNA-binding transcriptional ArsR family regulator
MIHLHLTPESLLRTRFAFSPLVEAAVSYHNLKREKFASPPLYHWAEKTRAILSGVELPLLDELMGVWGYVPDFLTPTPTQMEFNFERDLEQLRHTPVHLIQRDLTSLMETGTASNIREQIRIDPQAYKEALMDELRTYWRMAIQPHWANLVNIIEGDLLFRARQMALCGSSSVLSDLDAAATFDGKALRLDKKHYKKPDSYYVIDQEGLHLVPSVFGAGVMWQAAPEYNPMIIYGARGVGLWQQTQPDLDESLELLLGAGRAAVLAELDSPATTSELALNLHLTAGAVSQHLSVLNRAGLVHAHRSGKRVYYSLSQKGADLLRLFR